MELEEQIKHMNAVIVAMSEQQDVLTAELVGIKKSLAVMAAYLQMTEQDVSNAWEMATAQAGSAIELGGTPADMQPVELETIRVLLAGAGCTWRSRHREP